MTIGSFLFHIQFIPFDKAIHLRVRPNILEEMYNIPLHFLFTSDFFFTKQ